MKKRSFLGRQVKTMTIEEKNERDNLIQKSQLDALEIKDLAETGIKAVNDIKCQKDIIKNVAAVLNSLYQIKEKSSAIDSDLDKVISTYL